MVITFFLLYILLNLLELKFLLTSLLFNLALLLNRPPLNVRLNSIHKGSLLIIICVIESRLGSFAVMFVSGINREVLNFSRLPGWYQYPFLTGYELFAHEKLKQISVHVGVLGLTITRFRPYEVQRMKHNIFLRKWNGDIIH